MKPGKPTPPKPKRKVSGKMTPRKAVLYIAAAATGATAAERAMSARANDSIPRTDDTALVDSGDTDRPQRRKRTRMNEVGEMQDSGLVEDSAETLGLEGEEAERADEHYDFKQQAMADIIAGVTESVQVGWVRAEDQEEYDEFLLVTAPFGYPLGDIYPDEQEATLTFTPGDKLQEFCESELNIHLSPITVEDPAQMAQVLDHVVRLDGYANEYDSRVDSANKDEQPDLSDKPTEETSGNNEQAILNKAKKVVDGIDSIPSV